MIKKINLIALTIVLSLSFIGCNKTEENTEVYTFEEPMTQETEGFIEAILASNPTTLNYSKELNGTNLSYLYMKKLDTGELFTLGELTDGKKPTILMLISPYCSSCEDIDYTSIIALKDSYNIFIVTHEQQANKEFFQNKGLSNEIYVIDPNNPLDPIHPEKDKYLDDYENVIAGIGIPSTIYLNSDNSLVFGYNGTKEQHEIIKNASYLK